MQASLSHPAPSAHDFADNPQDARLRGLTHQQLADRLSWLSWYSPGVFAAVMDYMDFCDAFTADAHQIAWRSGAPAAYPRPA